MYFYFPFIITLFLFCYVFITHIVHLYQLNGYIICKTIKNYFEKAKAGDLLLYFVTAILFYLLFFLIANFVFRTVLISVFNLLFFIYLLNFIDFNKKTVKKPLKITKRVVRFIILYSAVLLGLLFVFAYFINNPIVFNSLVFLLPLCGFVLFLFTALVAKPIEGTIKLHIIARAKRKLSNYDNLIKVGITGSYGKTSTKFILDTILKEKYCVLSTPGSYNTPMGISKTILSDLEKNHEVFIMEMGADKTGDIKYLCKAFKPSIGILTSIGNAHLETFGSFENIVTTKCELPNNLYGKSLMSFNCNNHHVLHFANKYRKDKILVGDNYEICAKNIKITAEGCKFEIYNNGERFILAKTRLLGEHNITNILLCVGVAIRLGLNKQQISAGIRKLQPVKNRLELKKLYNGVVLLDDGYNSNPIGCDMALKTLDMFDAKRKIVITPGMVELGGEQYKENYKFGQKIASVANAVYIVNSTNKDAIKNGLFDENYDFNNVFFVKKFTDIDFSKFNQGDVVLIENDLPDNYI